MHLIRTRFLAFLAAAFVALPAQAFASTSYFCHMTGEVSDTCCCTGKSAPESCEAQVKEQDCCELITSHGQASAPATRESLQQVPAAALVGAIAFGPVVEAGAERLAVATETETHPPGPPRFLAHCSFLI
jgi:hypothetical protein